MTRFPCGCAAVAGGGGRHGGGGGVAARGGVSAAQRCTALVRRGSRAHAAQPAAPAQRRHRCAARARARPARAGQEGMNNTLSIYRPSINNTTR
jgi:hypothetical protein